MPRSRSSVRSSSGISTHSNEAFKRGQFRRPSVIGDVSDARFSLEKDPEPSPKALKPHQRGYIVVAADPYVRAVTTTVAQQPHQTRPEDLPAQPQMPQTDTRFHHQDRMFQDQKAQPPRAQSLPQRQSRLHSVMRSMPRRTRASSARSTRPMLDQLASLDNAKSLVDTFSDSTSHLKKSKRRGLDFNMPNRKARPGSEAYEAKVLGRMRGNSNRKHQQPTAHRPTEMRVRYDPVLKHLVSEFGRDAVIDQLRKGNLKETPNRTVEQVQFLAKDGNRPLMSRAKSMALGLNSKPDANRREPSLGRAMSNVLAQRLAPEIAAGQRRSQDRYEGLNLLQNLAGAGKPLCYDTQARCAKINGEMRRMAELKRKFRGPLLKRGERPQGLRLL